MDDSEVGAGREGDNESTPLLLQRRMQAQTWQWLEALKDVYDSGLQTASDCLDRFSKQPLTPLSRALLILIALLSLLASLFIGLYAGLQDRIRHGQPSDIPSEPIPPHPSSPIKTITQTVTSTHTLAPTPTNGPGSETCTSSECVLTASSILFSLDKNKSPCDDFYGFATGGWVSAHPVISNFSFPTWQRETASENRKTLERVLTQPHTKQTPRTPDEEMVDKMRTFYQSCNAVQRIEKLGDEPLLEVMRSMQAVQDQNKYQSNSVKLTSLLAYLHSIGVSALFDANIDVDENTDTKLGVIHLKPPVLGLGSKGNYLSKEEEQKYIAVLQRIFLELEESNTTDTSSKWPPWPWPPWDRNRKNPKPEQTALRLATSVFEFERKLSQRYSYNDHVPLKTYNSRIPFQMKNDLPSIDFGLYISAFSVRDVPCKYIVTDRLYFDSLQNVIDSAEPEEMEAYFVTRVVLTLARGISPLSGVWKELKRLSAFNADLQHAMQSRAEWCTIQVERIFPFAVSRILLLESSYEQSKEISSSIVNGIMDSFKASLNMIDWMDDATRQVASSKLEKLSARVASTIIPNLDDSQSVLQFYSAYKITDEDFFANDFIARRAVKQKEWSYLGKPVPNLKIPEPSSPEAQYYYTSNEAFITPGLILAPYLDGSVPTYLSFGSQGSITAAALSHAIGSVGHFYNENGTLQNWWSESTQAGYSGVVHCLSDQLTTSSNSTPMTLRMRIITANSAVVHAYRAWKSNLASRDEQLLPGLKYSRNQLFFISYAISHASAPTQASLDWIRSSLNTVVANTPDFAEVFQCTASSKMYIPANKKCRLWW